MARKQRKTGNADGKVVRKGGDFTPQTSDGVEGYDYGLLAPKAATQARASSRRIRRKIQHTIQTILEIGRELLAAKELLPHGEFGPWLAAEFGWTPRTARNFMGVAQWLERKTEIISDLQIAPTAAYLLAAPSTPEEARREALARAEAGQRITANLARALVADAKEIREVEWNGATPAQLEQRLRRALEHIRNDWNSGQMDELAEQLRAFADEVGE